MRWSANPGRTRIAVVDDRGRIGCRRLTAAGVPSPDPTPPDLPGTPWELLGWAGPNLVALRRRGEVRVVDVGPDAAHPRGCSVMGRAVRCAVAPSGGLEVLVAFLNGARVRLCLYRAETDSYLLVEGPGDFDRVHAWDPAARLIVAGFDDGLRFYGYGDEAAEDVDIAWPPTVRPVAATGIEQGVLGLTGVTDAGVRVPGVLDLSGAAARWFTEHEGVAAADISLSGQRILGVEWRDEAFAYRIMDLAGRPLARLGPVPGLASDLVFARDEDHLIGEHQSPVLPPAVVGFSTGGEAVEPRTPVCAAVWRLERPGGTPEWVFEPANPHGGTVVFLHGGPGGRLTQSYDPVIAALLRAGWRVLGPNYPGSAGYGDEFEALGRGDWGGVDARAIADRLRSVRPGPLCLYGQSYGAYLALLVAATEPGVADAVAVWAPVTDLGLLWRHSAGVQRRWLERELGSLRLDEASMLARSPIRHVQALSRLPLLIGHGRHDDRCPVEQSRLLVAQLNGRHRYYEDAAGAHAPSDWPAWTDAVRSHFGGSRVPS